MNFVRSKNFFIALCGLLIIGAVFFISFTGDRIKYGEADSSLEVIKRAGQVAAGEASRTDTDKDGLYDWEETLWGSDPEKADTDGDSTNDGDEVDANRNPAVAGPDDELVVDESTGDLVLPGAEIDLTETDKVGQAFFAKYLELRQSGMLEDTASQEDLFQSISASIIKKSQYQPLDASDILIINAQGTETAKTYANAVASVLLTHPGGKESEGVILLRALQEDKEIELEKLDPIIETYHALFVELKTIVTPKDAAQAHLALLNATGYLEQTIRDMRQAFTDPVVMFGGVSRYPQELVALQTALTGIRDYLLKNNVQFAPDELGNLLMATPPTE